MKRLPSQVESFDDLTPAPVELPPMQASTWHLERIRARVSDHSQLLTAHTVTLDEIKTQLAKLDGKITESEKLATTERNQWRRQFFASFAALAIGVLVFVLNRCSK